MASIQNPYYVSGSGQSYGDGIASIAQALLSGPSPDEIAAREADMRYRDALGGKALAETDLLTDKRKALGSLAQYVTQAMQGDPQGIANLTQALGQGDGLGELSGVVRTALLNSGVLTDEQKGYALAGAGTPLADNEALTPAAQAEKLRLAEDAAFARTKYSADSSAGASRYGSDRALEGTLGAARIGEEGALARVREQGSIDARKPNILSAGQTILYNDAPAFGGAGVRPTYTAPDPAANATVLTKKMELDAKVKEPLVVPQNSTVLRDGQAPYTAPGELKAAIGEIAQGADGRTLEGPPDPTGNGGKDPLDISPDETAKLGFAMDDFATAAGGVLDGATKNRLIELASQLYQQTSNSGTAAAQAWREIMGQEPSVEDNWFADNKVSPQRPIPGVNAADTSQYDRQPEAAAVPPPDQRKANAVYQTPKGPMMWTGTGWKPAT